MSRSTLDQARALHKTIMRLHRRVLVSSMRGTLEDGQSAPELSISQVTTIMFIRDYGEMSLKGIADAMCVSPPSASVMIERLVDQGMVTRRASRVDRREVCIAVTPEGCRAAEALEQALLKSLIELLERIGPESADQWCEVYARIQGCIDAESGEPESSPGDVQAGVR